MKYISFHLLLFLSQVIVCNQSSMNGSVEVENISNEILISDQKDLIDISGKDVESRFRPPAGYSRVALANNSFGAYLRQLPLKPHNSVVKYYNGKEKVNYDVYDAVVDLEIGTKDLHQCADAVMRLRAEYLWATQQYDKIHFNFTNGFRVDYTEWMKGKRIVVNGNSTKWSQKAEPSNSYKDLWNYLETVFTYAGTLSLSKELKQVQLDQIAVGDVFIRGGSPGHAVIVVDMAMDSISKDVVFLLAQSYMPAQEIQILKNPNNNRLSPWYSSKIVSSLATPEWVFEKNELKSFN